MEDEKKSEWTKIRNQLLCIFAIGFAILIIVFCYSIVNDCHSKGGEWNSWTSKCDIFTFESGLFGTNDIYNTCLYISEDQGVLFDGYCYEELPSKDVALESCITGCKLQAYFDEDISRCIEYCERYLINLE